MSKINLEIKSVCNLSRRPIAIANNPIKLATVNYIKRSLKSNNFVDDISYIENILIDYYDSLNYKTLNDLFGTEIKKLDANKKFYIVSGNHRISILSALDYKQVDVLNESTSFFKQRDRLNFNYKELPNVFSENNIENWPSVQSGFLQKKDAIEILRKFTEV